MKPETSNEEIQMILANRIHFMIDVAEREGVDFTVEEYHSLLCYSPNSRSSSWISKFYDTLADSWGGHVRVAYGLLFWGCGDLGDNEAVCRLVEAVQVYYDRVGATEYYKGIVDAGRNTNARC